MERNLLNLYSEIFTNNEKAIDFLLNQHIIAERIRCEKCEGEMKIGEHAIATNKKAYRCMNSSCKSRRSLLKGCLIDAPKISLSVYLRAIFCFTMSMSNQVVLNICEFSEPTYIKIEKKFRMLLERDLEINTNKLGGENVCVQVDETAICNGRIITNPSNTHDEMRNTIWIVGLIEESENKPIVLKIVPNRRIETLTQLFNEYLLPGTTIVTDGYPSYPAAVRNVNGRHVVINHSEGFTDENGWHTNLIENLWKHLKSAYRKNNGVRMTNLNSFICEFWWKRKYMKKKNSRSFTNAFYRLISLISNN